MNHVRPADDRSDGAYRGMQHHGVAGHDAQGAEIYAWNTVLEQTTLKPGEFTPFKSRLASPPAEGKSIDVRFFNKRDIAGGSI